MNPHVIIIGAGPAGLTAAYLLAKHNVTTLTLEADPDYVGGISRTVRYQGYHFDIGGHRFFSKSSAVEALWQELLPNDLLERPRSSRIYYRGKFFAYPLKAFDALLKLGVFESIACVLSYAQARLFPVRDARNFEDWVSNQFGKRLFRIFFKTYTEKVWGMDCREISADWAAQRIKGLSLGKAIIQAFGLRSNKGSGEQVIKTLIDSFRYPRRGPGMMWEAATEKIRQLGGEVRMSCKVTGLRYDIAQQRYEVTFQDQDGKQHRAEAPHVISSAPLRELMQGLSPAISERANKAAAALRYRDFLVVALMLRDRQLFDDNWIYIHDSKVKVGRIQNFKSWSPEMVPDPAMCCYGLEYFCFEGDGLWTSSDDELIALAKAELEQLGLAAATDVVDGCVVRSKKAYPVYDDEYAANVAVIRAELEQNFLNLHLVGRNGMHKYNNQDHAMMTAMLTVENILANELRYDVWRVNEDAEYHEAGAAGEQTQLVEPRLTPQRLSKTV